MTTATEQGPTEDNVEVSLYEVDRLAEDHPDWDDLSEEEKLSVLQGEDPDGHFEVHNVTLEDYHEHLADLSNPRTDVEPETASHIALGSDDTAPDPADTSVGSENNRFEVTDHDFAEAGRDLQTITLLSSDQAVGDTLLEAGLVSEANGGMFFNRVLLDDTEDRLQPKTQEYAVTIRINLQFRDASQV